ncbi:MAG: class I SAM-dependent methyltransferase [Magnetococcales bacterium]|nr:class I SAM-dependent methyltransferase [Magnetococcales bacterium]
MTAPLFPDRILATLTSPNGGGPLVPQDDALICRDSGTRFPFLHRVPSLYLSTPGEGNVITDLMQSFYTENPFPSYEGLEEFGELVSKGHGNSFSRGLLHAIGYNKMILECGCGTGQLSNYLQLNNNHVLGIDLSLASLALALEHKQRNQLTRSAFVQMNIFNLAIQDESFDVILSHGVLHHTHNARQAFAHIVKKLKPGGIVLVGLYNTYARIPTWLRSKVIRYLGPRIDYVVRHRIHDAEKARIWIQDQYFNPHETWHSIDDVLLWFRENGIDYLNCSPAILDTDAEMSADLFAATHPGSVYQRVVTQLSWIFSLGREGGLFDVVGRKRSG